MKFYDAGIIVLIVIISICVIGGVTSTFFLGKDNPIEETAEAIIKEETGLDIDLSPYVVGPVGVKGYQTIQSALDAADAAGGGVVYIMPDQYTENLTLYDGVHQPMKTFITYRG